MKKLFSLLALTLFLTGCNTATAQESAEPVGETVYVKVLSIAGNDLVVQPGDYPSTQLSLGASNGENGGEPPANSASTDSPPSGVPAGNRSSANTDSPPNSAPAGMSGSGGNASANATPSGQGASTFVAKGEQESLRIPVGVPITRKMGGSQTTASFTQIAVDDILQLTYSTTDSTRPLIGVLLVG